ncbi:MAG: DNA polymerase III subunit gamma/tau [Deltaproteobacteria bacterium]|nr:DNA polymerase III subunit gamma/tau [Deltaproteobacteria bacterium]
MSYQVLARKYRPQIFTEVIGQEHVTTTLANALLAGRLHHAYLFCGARGVGKTTIARILAKALNCERGVTAEPCGTCRSCAEITSGASLDVQEIDGASNTSVDDIREIRERVKFLPSSGKYKIYIIDEVHMLSTSAFNALLKTLEEPPAHVIFIFATTEVQKIPATILSRCQRYDFRRIPVSRIADALSDIAKKENITASSEALHLIAREAGGSMRDAESLFDQAIAFAAGDVNAETVQSMLGFLDRKQLMDLVRSVIVKDPKQALTLLDEVFAQGADLTRFGLDVLTVLRHLLLIRQCGHDPRLVDASDDEVKELGQLADQSGIEELQQMFSIWYDGMEDVARSSFPKILLDVLILRLCRVEPVKPLGELVSKIDALLGREPPSAPVQDVPKLKDATTLVRSGGASSTSPHLPAGRQGAEVPPLLPQQNVQQGDWLGFMRWIAVEEPKMGALIQHGTLVTCEEKIVRLRFENQLYADMMTEVDRQKHVEKRILEFFKRPMAMVVECEKSTTSPAKDRSDKIRQTTKEILDHQLVRDAAEIFGAELHDIKMIAKE